MASRTARSSTPRSWAPWIDHRYRTIDSRSGRAIVGIDYGWHSYHVGTHAWKYGVRALRDYLPKPMRFFHRGLPAE